MKISFLTPGVTPYVIGGLQRHSFNLAKHLATLGVRIDLYHTDFDNTQTIDQLYGMTDIEKENINNIFIPWAKLDHFPGHYIRSLKCFSQKAYELYQQQSESDFILGKSITAWAFTEAKLHGSKIPPIGVNLHGFEMFQTSANSKAWLENWLLRPDFSYHIHQANYLFSYGGRITELINKKLHIPNEQILEIPGGIDSSWLVDRVLPPSDPIRFIFVGRYERRKGIQELQTAIRKNPDWKNHAQFRFIGPIPKDKQLSLPNVSYAGPIRDESILQHELRQSDVLLCPSYSEGMPNVILEAMGSGLAVLATDVGAVCLLVDIENGVLLPKVSIPGITQGINHFLELTQTQFQNMKKSSLERIQSFTWDRIAMQTLEAIQKVVAA
ncbi:glycosyltransferase family 4 protein [Acaryochloris marina]|uniref:glycosyltransferase family 4 protein n=1 Tax=Acaryochloris marina TaxID=155978 RepID=UPI001BAFAE19|nr:glycosyltransferase family 4 protein [Acaryochloris marina]QUY40600.1 glycosyltransferase family 4 protein [Acaryochloris marina S15]